MEAGRLRFRVDLERPVETQNDLGEPEQAWKTFRTIWADIEPLSGQERFAMKQTKAEVDTKIIARASAARGVTPKMRVSYYDRETAQRRVFDIEAVIDWRNRKVMRELHCKEAV